MTPKEALKIIINSEVNGMFQLKKVFVEEWNTIETALNRLEELEKVLKIIKQKGVNTNLMFDKDCENVETYNEIIKSHIFMRYLTETEFNLLRKYLK